MHTETYQYITKNYYIIDRNGYLELSNISKNIAEKIIITLMELWNNKSIKMNGELVDKWDVYPNIKILIDSKYISLRKTYTLLKEYGISKAVLKMRINDLSKYSRGE